jgi:hypothetical protein
MWQGGVNTCRRRVSDRTTTSTRSYFVFMGQLWRIRVTQGQSLSLPDSLDFLFVHILLLTNM